jgi:hypothetical protein
VSRTKRFHIKTSGKISSWTFLIIGREKIVKFQTECEFSKEIKKSAGVMVQLLLSGNMYKILIKENLILNLLPRKCCRPKSIYSILGCAFECPVTQRGIWWRLVELCKEHT